MVNKRPLYVVFKEQGNPSIYRVKLDLDPRTWEPGRTVLTVRLRIPSNMPIGTYTLSLWLPDEYPSIAENPLYAVRFANQNVWEETTGFNRLGMVTIVEGTTGSSEDGEKFQILEQSSSTDSQK